MGSKLAMCHWPILSNAEPNSENIFSNYGMPSLSKKTPYHCNISSYILTEATKYLIIKLIGLGKIINGTQVVPIGHRWAILPNLIQGTIFIPN